MCYFMTSGQEKRDVLFRDQWSGKIRCVIARPIARKNKMAFSRTVVRKNEMAFSRPVVRKNEMAFSRPVVRKIEILYDACQPMDLSAPSSLHLPLSVMH
jgi:hypothetical protein